jgi:hypothetical protein
MANVMSMSFTTLESDVLLFSILFQILGGPSHPHGSLAPKLRPSPPLSQFLHPVSNGLHTVLDVLIAQGLAVHPQIHAHHVVLRRILWKGQLLCPGTQSQQHLLVWLVLNVGNGWEWGNGMIIDNYCGSFPKIPC